MNVDASALLKLLGAGPRTARLGEALASRPAMQAGQSSAGVETGQFADLLAKARAGELSSNQPVTISPEAASAIKLTEDQLAQISIAADKAEAEGLRTALVVLDDQQLVLDVASRTLKPAAGDGSLISGVDGVINLTTRQQVAPMPIVQPPDSMLSNASLASLLANRPSSTAA